jgi:hypothetical protein
MERSFRKTGIKPSKKAPFADARPIGSGEQPPAGATGMQAVVKGDSRAANHWKKTHADAVPNAKRLWSFL